MDVTSGAAVAALLLDLYDLNDSRDALSTTNEKSYSVQSLDDSQYVGKLMQKNERPLRVLDLCCAPG